MSTAVEHDVRHRSGPRPVAAPSEQAPTQRRWRHVAPPLSCDTDALRGSLPASLPAQTSLERASADPAPLLINLTRCVVEILAGVRSLEQVTRWVTDDVYSNLIRRVTIASRSRAITGGQVRRPRLTVGTPIVTRPCEGVVEAVVMVHQPTRSRAVAIRLEDLAGRWRASAITVL
ncbi:Rv3235 family protein [Leifsonia sp. NPDC058248]|uniref:Rv3235 family protein n=1 Tax=Leifsonia sp. NPDC058248 TaxID=3346402 RepID=UPI0036DEF7D7